MAGRLRKNLRFGLRTAVFVVNTLGCWGGLELAWLLRGKKHRLRLLNKWVSRWARNNLRIYNIQVDAHGPYVDEKKLYPSLGPDGVGRIFVLNHSSAIDIPIALALAEAHAISRHDLAQWPVIGKSSRRVGTLFVDRTNRRSGASVLQEVSQALAVGEGVVMFPEGTSFPGDEVHEFRNGAFNAARRAGAQIIPVGLAYGDDAAYYHHESFMSHVRTVTTLSKLPVAVEIGEPIDCEGRSVLEVKACAHEAVQQLVNVARGRLEGRVVKEAVGAVGAADC